MVAKSVPSPALPVLPRHVAIIMDGNGRWAERQGRPRIAGHQGGIEPVREIVKASAELGIATLTLFAFSSENFDRPPDEVSALMGLLLEALECEIAELDANGVRLKFVGDVPLLGAGLVEATRAAESRTAANSGLELVIAAAYGGRWDLTQAARRLAELARDGRLDPSAIDETTFGRALATGQLPPVDLLIRTGGEQRISNFLLWQIAYSELYFSECLWPEFDRAELSRALEFFARRERRFGRTHGQLGRGAC